MKPFLLGGPVMADTFTSAALKCFVLCCVPFVTYTTCRPAQPKQEFQNFINSPKFKIQCAWLQKSIAHTIRNETASPDKVNKLINEKIAQSNIADTFFLQELDSLIGAQKQDAACKLVETHAGKLAYMWKSAVSDEEKENIKTRIYFLAHKVGGFYSGPLLSLFYRLIHQVKS
jgi:hypothetical protein